MKNILKSRLFTFILGGIIFGSITGVVAYTINASNVEYKPSWTKENGDSINNVKEAVDELYKKNKFNIPKVAFYSEEVGRTYGWVYLPNLSGYRELSIDSITITGGKLQYVQFRDEHNNVLSNFNLSDSKQTIDIKQYNKDNYYIAVYAHSMGYYDHVSLNNITLK